MRAQRLYGSVLSAVVVAAAVGSVLAGAATAAAAEARPATAGGTWGTPHQVPGLAALNVGGDAWIGAVSCASAGNCSVGGSYLDGNGGEFQAFVASETAGTWGAAREVPGTAALNVGFEASITSLSCASAGNCSAGGFYTDASDRTQAFVVTEANGTWGAAQEVPGVGAKNAGGHAQITSVSCAAPGDCSAVGFFRLPSFTPRVFTVSQTHGVWGTAKAFPGLAARKGPQTASSVSCASVGNCSAGGSFTDSSRHEQAYVVTETNGAWGTAIAAPGVAALNTGGRAQITALSCGAPGNCGAGGTYQSAGRVHPFVVSESNGTWGTARQVPGIGALGNGGAGIDSLSCAAAGNCGAAGTYLQLSGGALHSQAYVVSENNGSWGTARPLPGAATLNKGGGALIGAVSCAAAGNCAIAGSYTDAAGHGQAFVASQANGTWGPAQEVPGTAALNHFGAGEASAVSCGAVGNCAAGGYYTDTTGQQVFVVNQT